MMYMKVLLLSRPVALSDISPFSAGCDLNVFYMTSPSYNIDG